MRSFPLPCRGASVPGFLSGISLSLILTAGLLQAQPGPSDSYPYTDELSLQEYMQRVVDFNETVQAKLLGFHAARRQRDAEMGEFEPALVASAEFVDRRIPNKNKAGRDQDFAQSVIDGTNPDGYLDVYPGIYDENSWRLSSAVEVRSPLGTLARLGVTSDDFYRNSSAISDTPGGTGIQGNFMFTLEQPLLKGFGFAANLASLRMAARQSEIAFQDYRRELMTVVAEAELAYWDLYYAQEELQLSRESVQMLETFLEDSQASFEAGRGSRLDVLEMEAKLAIRQSAEREAYQKRIEALNNLASYFGGVPRANKVDYRVIDAPASKPVETLYEEGKKAAMSMNPDFLKARIQTEQERIRLGYSKNQRLPEVSLKADVGAYGFADRWNETWDEVVNYGFPSWSVGLVVRIPLWGDVRGRNEHRAALLRLQQAERTEANLLTQIQIGCDTAEQRISSNFTSARSLESVVDFRDNLLETRMQERDIGRMDARSVLEAEQELFDARLEQLQSEIDYQRSLLELQLISGCLLQVRNLEVEFEELEERTTYWSRNDERQTPAMRYYLADFNRLPVDEPVAFASEEFVTPWLGIDWSTLPYRSYDKPYKEEKHDLSPEPQEQPVPRRFDGSHIR